MRVVALFERILTYALYVYLLLVLGRLVVEATRQFARAWRPVGYSAVGLELMYMATDPPIKVLRRLIPPLRIGPVSIDLSILIVLIVLWLVLGLVLPPISPVTP